MGAHVPFRQQLQGFRADAQPAKGASRQYDRCRTVVEQLGNVGRLDARPMGGPGLVPIPFPGPAWEDLGIAERADALDFDPSPRQSRDPGGPLERSGDCSWSAMV